MPAGDFEIEGLIERASRHEPAACQELLIRHRQRLRQMIAVRIDHRLAARLDPSDVVQEVFVEALGKMPDYLRERPLPFYPWLRQLAWERLAKLHERHIQAQKRTTTREARWVGALPDESALALVDRLVAPGSSPSKQVLRQEMQGRVQAALARLTEQEREVLVMRYLEQLSIREIGAVLGITESGVKSRHLRALQRIRGLLSNYMGEGQP
jgi:RNA polymerase sigma-70 factor (ECF subfamily)